MVPFRVTVRSNATPVVLDGKLDIAVVVVPCIGAPVPIIPRVALIRTSYVPSIGTEGNVYCDEQNTFFHG